MMGLTRVKSLVLTSPLPRTQLHRQLGASEGPVCYAELLIVHNVVNVVCSVIHVVMEDRGVRVGKAHSFGLL